jgi:hypothetical protein
MAWLVVLAELYKCTFFRAADAAGIDASSPLRHANNPCKAAIDFFGCVCRREHLVAAMAENAPMTVDANAIICPYAPFGRYPGKRGVAEFFVRGEEKPAGGVYA